MAVQLKSLKDLSLNDRRLYERAETSVAQKNFSYAFEMLRGVLRKEPGFVEGRTLLRKAQLDRFGGKVGAVAQAMAAVKTALPILIKGPVMLQRGKFLEALDVAERALEQDPTSSAVLTFLAKAAEGAGLMPVAVDAYEMAANFHPKDPVVLQALSKAYEATNDFAKALQTSQQVAALKPDSLDLQNETKRLSALAAMHQGKWESAGSYRDIIKDKEVAQTLEQQSRVTARDADTLRDLIKAAKDEVTRQPSATNHKKLAELLVRNHEYDQALEAYDQVVACTGTLDPAIDAAMTAVHVARFDDAIAQWKQYAAEHPDKQGEAEATVAEIGKQKDELLIKRLRDRVQRYPNDASYHFELGEMLFARQEIDNALQEFQFSQRSPQFRRAALANMGRCMLAKKLYDLAIEQFGAALEGLEKSDHSRKEFLYYLAQAYEQKNRADDALNCYKEIYSLDVNFRDVAAKLQAHYDQPAAV
ncbi:MAG: tetratricopeptide repeat protein [Lentisphaeria bacterium]